MKRERLKVCLILPPIFPVPAIRGGAIETLISNLIIENKGDSEIELTVCSVYDREAESIAKKEEYQNVHFFWTYPKKWRYRISDFFFRVLRKILKIRIVVWMAHYNEIARFIRYKKFDLIIAEGGDYQSVLDISQKYYKSSELAIHIHHHYLPNSSIASGYGILIGVSDFVVEEYLKQCKNEPRTYVLKNCIDLKKFERHVAEEEKVLLRKKNGINAKDFLVLYVGRIIEVKGILELIEGLLCIPDDTVKLLIIGSPNFSQKSMTPYLKKMMHMVKQHADRIKFTGYIPNEELYKYYKIADIQCVPSVGEEAAGLVVLEGMAAGLPLIVSDSGGMVEYVTEETALIVKRNDLRNNLSSAIQKLSIDIEQRKKMSLAAKKYVEQYSAANYYANFQAVLMDAVKGQKNENRNSDIS